MRKFGTRPHEETLDVKTLNRIARFTAYGIYNTLLFWPSDCVILGGGLVMHGVIKLIQLRDTLKGVIQSFLRSRHLLKQSSTILAVCMEGCVPEEEAFGLNQLKSI